MARTIDRSFECARLEGEDEDAFVTRANTEFRKATSKQVEVLLFDNQEEEETLHAN
jgi:hypothetical protein